MPQTSFLYFLILEQTQHGVYREVSIAGDLSQGDIDRVAPGMLQSDGSVSDTAEFSYGDDIVYFAQPTRSQFIPGGSGQGTLDAPVPLGLKDTPNISPGLTGRTPLEGRTGAILRYAPPVYESCASTS